MKLHEYFLPQDMIQASKCYSSFTEEIKEVTKHLNNGELDIAKIKAVDVLNALHELSVLAERKNEIDRREFMINQLNLAGVHIQTVRRLHHD